MDPIQKAIQDVYQSIAEGDHSRAGKEGARLAAKYPKNSFVQLQVAGILRSTGFDQDAAILFKRAIDLEPDLIDAYAGLAEVLISLGRFEEARSFVEKGLELAPDSALIHGSASSLEEAVGTIARMRSHAERALSLSPESDQHVDLCFNALLLEDEKEAFRFLSAEVEKREESFKLPLALAAESLTPEWMSELEVADHIRLYGKRVEKSGKPMFAFKEGFDANRKIRVGFVSADLRRHSVAFFLLPLVKHLDQSQFEIFFYPLCSEVDDMSRILKKHGRWMIFRPTNPIEMAEQICRDRIDLLVDLGGLTTGARPETFALRPAPVQVSMIGFPHSIGMGCIDARIGDTFTDPFDQQQFHAEKVIRMEPPFLCYSSDTKFPDLVPIKPGSPVVFCSMNHPRKIGINLLKSWKKILDQVPNSRLLLKNSVTNRSAALESLMRKLEEAGLSDKVDLLERTTSEKDHRATYLKADIALDSYPYNGTTTTIESLLMGVPVVTRIGDSHRSRVSAMMLEQIGFADWIGRDEKSYIDCAVALARDVETLRAMRGEIRERVESSALMDGPGYASKVGNVFRNLWIERCAAQGNDQ